MSKVAFIGSFKDFHQGHQNILLRSSKLFCEVFVIVLNNKEKGNEDTLKERFDNVKKKVEQMNLLNVSTLMSKGKTVDVLKNINVNVIVRGMRNTNDFFYEQELERNYKKDMNSIEVVYLLNEIENE